MPCCVSCDVDDVGVIPQALLTDEDLAQAPFLILGNKIDLPSAASEDELRTALGIHNLTTGKEASPERAGLRPIEIFMCSVLKRQGFREVSVRLV